MQPRNPYLCLSIVVVLGVTAQVGLVGVIVASYQGHDAPSALVAIASACVGALSSFLVSVPRGSAGHPGDGAGPREEARP